MWLTSAKRETTLIPVYYQGNKDRDFNNHYQSVIEYEVSRFMS